MVIPNTFNVEATSDLLGTRRVIRSYRNLSQIGLDLEEFDLEVDGSIFEDNTIGGLNFKLITGVESVRLWILKTLSTQRGVFVIYDDNYGLGLDDLIGSQLPIETVQALLEVFVEEALLFHPSIVAINNYTSYYEDENIFIDFHAVLEDEEELSISTSLRV